jgi:hypothetical protein
VCASVSSSSFAPSHSATLPHSLTHPPTCILSIVLYQEYREVVFAEGESVEARYNGDGIYFPGVIAGVQYPGGTHGRQHILARYQLRHPWTVLMHTALTYTLY